MKKKELKIWNGRWYDANRKYDHAFICAYSRADAARVITEYLGYEPRGILGELKNFFNEGCWGNSMEGIKKERGLWLSFKHDKPIRVL